MIHTKGGDDFINYLWNGEEGSRSYHIIFKAHRWNRQGKVPNKVNHRVGMRVPPLNKHTRIQHDGTEENYLWKRIMNNKQEISDTDIRIKILTLMG